MALNAPYLPPNPHRPRAFGGKGAGGLKKQILSNNNEPDPKSREVSEGIAKAALDAIVRNAGAVKAEQLRRKLDAQAPEPEDHPHPETSNGDPVEK